MNETERAELNAYADAWYADFVDHMINGREGCGCHDCYIREYFKKLEAVEP